MGRVVASLSRTHSPIRAMVAPQGPDGIFGMYREAEGTKKRGQPLSHPRGQSACANVAFTVACTSAVLVEWGIGFP